jgi:peptide methionine sulfoxide reductase MsrA
MKKFYPAEDYHQNYFAENPRNPYCQAVVGPKVSKFQKRYKDMLKKREEPATK